MFFDAHQASSFNSLLHDSYIKAHNTDLPNEASNTGEKIVSITVLAIVDISALQSPAQIFIHNVILFIDTSNNAWHNQAHWLIGMPYLSTIASNE